MFGIVRCVHLLIVVVLFLSTRVSLTSAVGAAWFPVIAVPLVCVLQFCVNKMSEVGSLWVCRIHPRNFCMGYYSTLQIVMFAKRCWYRLVSPGGYVHVGFHLFGYFWYCVDLGL